jgi:hypothetical protein
MMGVLPKALHDPSQHQADADGNKTSHVHVGVDGPSAAEAGQQYQTLDGGGPGARLSVQSLFKRRVGIFSAGAKVYFARQQRARAVTNDRDLARPAIRYRRDLAPRLVDARQNFQNYIIEIGSRESLQRQGGQQDAGIGKRVADGRLHRPILGRTKCIAMHDNDEMIYIFRGGHRRYKVRG